MHPKYLLAAALVAGLVVPAAAATPPKKPAPKAYYAEQVVKSQACYAVTFKPNGKTATQIGTDSYPSLAKALAAIKADTSCKPVHHMAKAKTPAKPKG